MFNCNNDNECTCLFCKHSLSTDEDELYCELAEDVVGEEDTCEDYKGN